MGYVSTGMGDRFRGLLVSDGFAARVSRGKPLSILFIYKFFVSLDFVSDCFQALMLVPY